MMMTKEEEYVILVDEQDTPIGTAEKMEAHRQGMLHRAFSVVITNSAGHLLLQQRAINKYHCGGLWTNTCCSHPRPDELTEAAAKRRLQEEMGLETSLIFLFRFVYWVECGNGLIEHESDHVYWGVSDEKPNINIDEVQDYKYLSWDDLEYEIKITPTIFTPWFKIMYPNLKKLLNDPLEGNKM